MSDLTELLERVKAATEPDRELDRDLTLAMIRGSRLVPYWNEGHCEDDFAVIVGTMEGKELYYVPILPMTTSIDAALALVERVLPEWFYWLVSDEQEASLYPPNWPDRAEACGNHKHMPLAILAALLKAKIAESGQ